MHEPIALTAQQACVLEWYRGQNLLAGVTHPMVRHLKQLTRAFLQGPWAHEAFAAGWTDRELFGLPLDFDVATPGLVPLMALGLLRPVILGIDAEAATVLGSYGWHGEDSIIRVPRCDALVSVLWWRHPVWTYPAFTVPVRNLGLNGS